MQHYATLLLVGLALGQAAGWKLDHINLALKKPTLQSSTAIYWNARSHLAVDGNNCSDFFKCKTCTHSDEDDYYPWWRVDIEAGFEITHVVVTGRDNMQWRLHAAQVRVGYNDDEVYNANPLCKDSITLADDVQENWKIHCNMNGRYVTVALPGDKETLTLCEVEVYGKPIVHDTGCYYGRGENYRGYVSNTLSGRTCQSWRLQHPHGHSRTPENNPTSGLESNYCRNPDGTSQPWCYTTDPDTRWEYCFEEPVCNHRYREDLRCGNDFKLASGKKAECNPDDPNGYTCCSAFGYCGNTQRHCHCDECINYSKDNLALGKTAIQSSTDHDGPAHLAIDGIRGRGYDTSMSCTHTYDGGYNWNSGSANPWWRVDLYNEYAVNKVVISNREDCCGERLDGFQVRVGMSSSRTWDANPMCGTSNKVIDGKLVYEVHCHGRRGRFVTVTVPGDHNILTLCEVEVYGGIPPKDPCENNNCAGEADCKVVKDSYTCTCQEGYEGDGKTCTKVSECDASPCHALARCTDTAEGHTCICKDGYDGDGVSSCSDVNECESGDACDADAQCINKDGTFVCECDEGYTGDGFSCKNVDECATNSHMCLPDVAECYDDEGTYGCECIEGYLGDGTTECKDEDECTYEGMCSYPHSVCVNLPGSFKCVCEEGYEGDHSECERTFDDTESAVVRAMNPVLYGKLGGMAKFLIRVKADHRIDYERLIWTKLPDINLSPPPFDHIKTPNYRRTLVIRKILPEDAGEYNLEVLGIEGATVTVQLAIAEPISAVKQNLTASIGTSVRFDLKFNVWPVPTYKLITWSMGEKNLSPPPTPKYATPNNRKQLVINKIQKADEGEYTCTLKMLIRGIQVERSYSVFLTVKDKEEL